MHALACVFVLGLGECRTVGRIVVAEDKLLGRILKVVSIHQAWPSLTRIHVFAKVQLRAILKLEYTS